VSTKDLSASTADLAALQAAHQLRSAAIPGVIQIFTEPHATLRAFRLDRGTLELGRTELATDAVGDSAISRKHVRLSHDREAFGVEDLNSRNGTSVRARPLSGRARWTGYGVIRVGGSLLVTVDDVTPFENCCVTVHNEVLAGPSLRAALDQIAFSASVSPTLMIRGESGTGKEIAARAFHQACGVRGGFSAINCATIPKDLAERELFGSRRGAFSGATDAGGYVQAAHRGTLFLDEIAELPMDVQSKLLRVVETQQVFRLGSASPERIEFRLCAATWRNLKEEVRVGRFREDLYFRIGQPEVQLPALRARPEEIPFHITRTVDECARTSGKVLRVSAGFVEACLLRSWPGNIRELRAEVRRSSASALGRKANILSAEDLCDTAGIQLDGLPLSAVRQADERTNERPALSAPSSTIPKDDVSRALMLENGNVVAAARRLGVNRNRVRTWLIQQQLDARAFKSWRK
jgi:DNA-binding NtrC family response regulator